MVVDRPYASGDVATASPISTHTHIHVHTNTSTRTQYPILVAASSSDLCSRDLFLFIHTLTMRELELVSGWRESTYHIISVVVFLGGR